MTKLFQSCDAHALGFLTQFFCYPLLRLASYVGKTHIDICYSDNMSLALHSKGHWTSYSIQKHWTLNLNPMLT